MEKYNLVFSDDFSDKTLNMNKWQFDTGGHGFGNAEAQYYTDREKNIRIENNRLVIEAHREDFENCNFTSGKLTTKETFQFQYGRVEVRAKFPKGRGTWPAIWMLPLSFHRGEKWPRCGEIDIVEHVGRKQDQLHFSLHCEAFNHNKGNQRTHFDDFSGVCDDFNLYAIEWERNEVAYFVNKKEVARFTHDPQGKEDHFAAWPFNQPFYLILNLAMGGYWGGDIDDAIFLSRFEIDFVKIYQRR